MYRQPPGPGEQQPHDAGERGRQDAQDSPREVLRVRLRLGFGTRQGCGQHLREVRIVSRLPNSVWPSTRMRDQSGQCSADLTRTMW